MNLYFSSWTSTISSEAASDGEETSDVVVCGEGHGCTLPEEGPLASMSSSWLSSVRWILRLFNFSTWILSTMKSLQVLEEESGSSTPGPGSPWKKVTLRHLVIGTMYSDMQYGWIVSENTLSDVFMEMCQAICDKYADEVMVKMDRDNLLIDSTGLEISPTVLLLLMASMWQSESLLCLARFIIIYNFCDFVSSEAWDWQNPSKFYSLYCTSLIIYTKRSFELAHELKHYALIITMCWCIVVQ